MRNQKLLRFAAVFLVSLPFIGITPARSQTPVKPVVRAASHEVKPGRVPTNLPVRRVSLYKNGVGFFEHIGSVNGNQQVTIDFTTSQLNDVLQTLTAIDLNGGRVGGAGYNSTTPLDEQLKSLPLALGADASAADFYQAIRGARVEVRSGAATIKGRLLSMEVRQDTTQENGATKTGNERRFITVVSEAGEVRTIELTSNTEVRLLDTALHQDVNQYLELLASTHSQGLRHLTLAANGTGTRELHVSYLSEVPIWKATYRILFSNGDSSKGVESATLQGWAVVDNTVGTDWEKVELSLIAGAPQSFIQPISQPYYSRRPEIELPQEAQLTPQTHESGEEMIPRRMADVPPPPPAMGSSSGGGVGAAHGVVGGILGGMGSAPAPVMKAARPISYEDSASQSVSVHTKTTAFDDYFEYKLSSPITIRKNESALVPILQTKVDAERLTLWSPSQPQALRALWLTNGSDLTIDRGSFSIVEDGKFGGEGLLDPIHPKEKRLLSYAADQAVRVTTDYQHDTRKLQQVAVSKGILTEKTAEIAEVEYLVRNAAPEARSVIVEYPRRAGWELDSEVKPVETTTTAYRYRVTTAPGETVRLHIGERHTISQRYQLANMGTEQLDLLIRTNGEDARLREQLAPIFDEKRKLAEIDAQINAAQKAIDEIANDQKRVRENLAALKGSAEERALVKRYTDELNQQEDQLASLKKQQEALRTERATAEADLSLKIQALQMDENLG